MNDLGRMCARMIGIGFDGPHLNDEARSLLERGVSAVVLFTRNFQSAEQLRELTAHIKGSVDYPVLIGVDHEGGRVQRFHGEHFNAYINLVADIKS